MEIAGAIKCVWPLVYVTVNPVIAVLLVLTLCVFSHATMVEPVLLLILVLVPQVGSIRIALHLCVPILVPTVVTALLQIHAPVPLNGLALIVALQYVHRHVLTAVAVSHLIRVLVHPNGSITIALCRCALKVSDSLHGLDLYAH